LQLLPQDVQQQSTGLDRYFMGAAIDPKFDEFFFHESFQPLAASSQKLFFQYSGTV